MGLGVAIAASLLQGCATLWATDMVRSPLTPVADTSLSKVVMLNQSQAITLDTGVELTLTGGSHWKLAGTIVEGQVYQPVDGQFTIGGREPVSAYLVVSSGQLIGFFLPGDEGFSPLMKKISIAFVPLTKSDRS